MMIRFYIHGDISMCGKQDFKGAESGKIFRRDIPEEIYRITGFDKDKFVVKGSIGQGAFAEIPWVAIFNIAFDELLQLYK